MANKKISNLPEYNTPQPNDVLPIVNVANSVTQKVLFSAISQTITSGLVDVFVTGGTYSAGTATFINNTGGTFSVSGFTD